MALILLAQELGSGLGHVTKLLPIARALAQRGHRAVFALPEPRLLTPLLNDDRYTVIASPRWPASLDTAPFNGRTYSDILARRGYLEQGRLRAMVGAWQGVVDALRPDLIVADHSPTLCLSVAGVVPVVHIGSGFTVPPVDQDTFPPFRSAVTDYAQQDTVLKSIQAVQRVFRRPVPERITDLFAGAQHFVCVAPELDPYTKRRTTPAMGTHHPSPVHTSLPDAPKVFVYLKQGEAQTREIIQFLLQGSVEGAAYIAGADQRTKMALAQTGFHVFERPPPLREVLPGVSAVIHHGGVGTAGEAMTAGRVQITAPRFAEQTCNSNAVKALGIGVDWQSISGPGRLSEVMTDRTMQHTAQALAADIARRNYAANLGTITDACCDLLGQSPHE